MVGAWIVRERLCVLIMLLITMFVRQEVGTTEEEAWLWKVSHVVDQILIVQLDIVDMMAVHMNAFVRAVQIYRSVVMMISALQVSVVFHHLRVVTAIVVLSMPIVRKIVSALVIHVARKRLFVTLPRSLKLAWLDFKLNNSILVLQYR